MMQRFSKTGCQQRKQKMKTIALVLPVAAFASCKKDKDKWITGTVIQQGCYPNSWLVQLDHPNHSSQSFLCVPTQAMASSATTNCGNTAVVLDMPAALAHNGARIKFSKWEDKGLLCFSSTLAPHHLQVADVEAN
jgi:hypothetical protein